MESRKCGPPSPGKGHGRGTDVASHIAGPRSGLDMLRTCGQAHQLHCYRFSGQKRACRTLEAGTDAR